MESLSVPYKDYRWSHQLLTTSYVFEQASRICSAGSRDTMFRPETVAYIGYLEG